MFKNLNFSYTTFTLFVQIFFTRFRLCSFSAWVWPATYQQNIKIFNPTIGKIRFRISKKSHPHPPPGHKRLHKTRQAHARRAEIYAKRSVCFPSNIRGFLASAEMKNFIMSAHHIALLSLPRTTPASSMWPRTRMGGRSLTYERLSGFCSPFSLLF